MTTIVKRLADADFKKVVKLLDMDEKIDYIEVSGSTYDSKGGEHYGRMSVRRTKSDDDTRKSRRIPVNLVKGLEPGPLGLYVSWALVSTIDGTVYKDTDGDTVTDEELEKAYMHVHGSAVPLYRNHDENDDTVIGSVAYAPLTDDIVKGLGFTGDKRGLVGFAHITDESVRKEIADGTMPDMSIEARVTSVPDDA